MSQPTSVRTSPAIPDDIVSGSNAKRKKQEKLQSLAVERERLWLEFVAYLDPVRADWFAIWQATAAAVQLNSMDQVITVLVPASQTFRRLQDVFESWSVKVQQWHVEALNYESSWVLTPNNDSDLAGWSRAVQNFGGPKYIPENQSRHFDIERDDFEGYVHKGVELLQLLATDGTERHLRDIFEAWGDVCLLRGLTAALATSVVPPTPDYEFQQYERPESEAQSKDFCKIFTLAELTLDSPFLRKVKHRIDPSRFSECGTANPISDQIAGVTPPVEEQQIESNPLPIASPIVDPTVDDDNLHLTCNFGVIGDILRKDREQLLAEQLQRNEEKERRRPFKELNKAASAFNSWLSDPVHNTGRYPTYEEQAERFLKLARELRGVIHRHEFTDFWDVLDPTLLGINHESSEYNSYKLLRHLLSDPSIEPSVFISIRKQNTPVCTNLFGFMLENLDMLARNYVRCRNAPSEMTVDELIELLSMDKHGISLLSKMRPDVAEVRELFGRVYDDFSFDRDWLIGFANGYDASNPPPKPPARSLPLSDLMKCLRQWEEVKLNKPENSPQSAHTTSELVSGRASENESSMRVVGRKRLNLKLEPTEQEKAKLNLYLLVRAVKAPGKGPEELLKHFKNNKDFWELAIKAKPELKGNLTRDNKLKLFRSAIQWIGTNQNQKTQSENVS